MSADNTTKRKLKASEVLQQLNRSGVLNQDTTVGQLLKSAAAAEEQNGEANIVVFFDSDKYVCVMD